MDREEDQRRYFIVVSVIFEVVTPLLRQRLERHYKKERCPSLLNFLDKQPVIHILFHLRYRDKLCCCDRVNCKQSPAQPLFYDQWKLLYSQKATPPCQRLCHTKFKANHVQLNELDLTLAGLLVMECTSLTLVEYEAMANLRKFKNEYLSHNTDGIILEDEFDTLWENLIDNVNHLAPNQEDFLRQIKNRTLDGRLCKKYMTDMLNIFCKLDKIDDKIDMNTEQIDIYGEKIERILAIVEKKGHTDKGKPQQFIQLCRLGQDVFCHDYQETYLGVLGSFDGLLTDNGRNVVSNGQKKQLLICDIDGSHLNTLQLQCKPWSITMITPSIVAVTLLIKHCVELYDINKQQKQKSIPVPGKCYGITTINNKLARKSHIREEKLTSPYHISPVKTAMKLISNPLHWSVQEVVRLINGTDCAPVARVFKEQEIDGQALLLLNLPTVQEYLDLKLGPAIKLCHHVEKIKVAFFQQFAH